MLIYILVSVLWRSFFELRNTDLFFGGPWVFQNALGRCLHICSADARFFWTQSVLNYFLTRLFRCDWVSVSCFTGQLPSILVHRGIVCVEGADRSHFWPTIFAAFTDEPKTRKEANKWKKIEKMKKSFQFHAFQSKRRTVCKTKCTSKPASVKTGLTRRQRKGNTSMVRTAPASLLKGNSRTVPV